MVAESGNGWRLAPSLVKLMDEIDAAWPKRKKSSDGSIGDDAHRARPSEHNPDRDSDGMPRGLVSAVDVTKDSAAQMDTLRRALIGDSRVWYVIHNGQIYSRTYGFRARRYNGNPHSAHMHVSLVQSEAAANSTRSWGISKPVPSKPKPKPAEEPDSEGYEPGERTLNRGERGDDVELLQRYLGVRETGVFDAVTETAVKRYQKMRGLKVDGVVGPKTWAPILKVVDR